MGVVEEAWAFYHENYDVVSRYGIGSGKRQSIGKTNPRTCRYCRRTDLETSFRKIAHTVPTLLGNTVLFSLDECSDCNFEFGLLENDLGKFTMPSRMIGRVAGYSKIPDQKFRSGATMKVDRSGDLHVTHNREDFVMETDPVSKTIRIRSELQAYRPLAVYKAFTKMAFGVLPMVEASNLETCHRWLASNGVTAGFPHDGLFPYLLETETGLIANNPSITVFRRKQSAQTCYVTAIICIGNCTYQIFLPAPERDLRVIEFGKPMIPFPPPLADGNSVTKGHFYIHDLKNPNQVKGQTREHLFTYNDVIEI